MRDFVSVDFETRSTIDLRRSGVYPYAKHESTDIWCVAYLIPGDEKPRVWRPGDALDPELVEWAAGNRPMRAWNANFERVIWNEIMVGRYGWPETTIEQWFCTAADARAMALPGQLGDAAKALGVDHQKDSEGKNLMLRMARPRKVNEDGSIEWWAVPDRINRLIAYCRQDVLAELDVHQEVRPLSTSERAVFELDQRINDRGIRFDRELATAARDVAKIAMEEANKRLRAVSGGAIHSVAAVGQMVAWLRERGVDTDSVTKQAVRDMKAQDLPDDVREVLTIREELGKSSVAKIESMFEAACPDDRIRGLLMYHGAATGRWSGRLVQPQNFPRGTVNDPEQFIPLILAKAADEIDLEYPVLDVISSMLRCMLTASPGNKLVAADLSAIEARVIAWLAGEKWRMDVFRSHGKIYEASAAMMFGVAIDSIVEGKPEYALRQKGKVAELALGFQGGVGAMKTMGGADMGLDDDEMKSIVTRWREKSPAIVSLWAELEGAALMAVNEPGTRQMAASGRIRFMCKGGYLWMRLPSGRLLCYSRPRVEDRVTPWGKTKAAVTVYGVNSVTRRWEKYALYGGLLTENAVQAIARDVLVEAMLRADNAGYPAVLSVHDEIVTEVPEAFGSAKELEQMMSVRPDWAPDLPLKAKGWENFRFRK